MKWRVFVQDHTHEDESLRRFRLHGSFYGDRMEADGLARSLRIEFAQVLLYPVGGEVYDSYARALDEVKAFF